MLTFLSLSDEPLINKKKKNKMQKNVAVLNNFICKISNKYRKTIFGYLFSVIWKKYLSYLGYLSTWVLSTWAYAAKTIRLLHLWKYAIIMCF